MELKIVFMGTPEFGATILEGLIKANFKPVLVITAPDKPVGRKQILTPPPVKLIAQTSNIPFEQPESILNLKSQISNLKPDLIIVAAYGQIFPQEILDIPKRGSLNVHPSLLPKYRGSSPIQNSILNDNKETGVSVILMDARLDCGPILSQRKTEIGVNETAKQLHDRLAIMGSELLIDTIPDWIRGQIKIQPQEETTATYTKTLKREDGKINWGKSAEEIEKQIRAFDYWPGSFTLWQILKGTLLRVKILKTRVFRSFDGKKYPIGKILVVPQNEIGVQCEKDFLILEELQLEGKRPMASEKFLRGHPDFIGTILK